MLPDTSITRMAVPALVGIVTTARGRVLANARTTRAKMKCARRDVSPYPGPARESSAMLEEQSAQRWSGTQLTTKTGATRTNSRSVGQEERHFRLALGGCLGSVV